MQRRTLLAAAAAIAVPAYAQQALPSRPIRLLVGFPAGGAPDILARLFADKLAAEWGQPVTVENRPGAQGTIAADAVAKAAADGTTLVLAPMSAHVISPLLMPRAPFDPVAQFTPLAVVGSSAAVLVSGANLPARSLREFVALAKASPGKYSFGSTGAGSIPHIAGEMFNRAAGVQLLHVPYKGFAQAAPDLVEGRVSVMFNAVAPTVPLVRDGKLRALAVTAERRTETLKDVPTFAEEGVRGMEINGWYGVLAPAGLPAPMAQRMAQDLLKVAAGADVRARYQQLGLDPLSLGAAEFGPMLRSDVGRWRDVLRENNIQVE
ncbi:MAG TPA: tripartite tricarboxylate transporter substrate binding protein [Ramlibacter sp.]|nr:tripartite tricarboxylate transporter substrate binding protein [Ramlibacter sp.]